MNDADKEKWLKDNPEAWRKFVEYSLQVAKTGKKFSFKLVVERLRWQSYFNSTGKYKFNNSVTAYAGRKFLEIYPEYKKQVSVRK